MSYIKSYLILFFLATIFMACNEDKEKSSEKLTSDEVEEASKTKSPTERLEGAWEIMRAEGIAVKSNLGTVYTFDGNNLTMGKNGFNNPGKTEITDSTFSFQANGNEYKFLFHYSFNGDTLVTSMENSNGQHFYMIKR